MNKFYYLLFFLLPFLGFSQDYWSQQLGQTLYGDVIQSYFGGQPAATNVPIKGDGVALNAAGDILAVGAPGNNVIPGNDYLTGSIGQVKIFRYIDSSWEQIGQGLYGEATPDRVGSMVTLNAAGDIVAIGSRTVSNTVGRIDVFQYNGTDWIQLGQSLYGLPSNTSALLYQHSLSADGLTIALSQNYQPNQGNNSIGLIRIYHYNGTQWEQVGENIVGDEGNYIANVSLSSDGQILAVGKVGYNNGTYESGQARVYHYSSGSWVRLGQDIEGTSTVTAIGNTGSNVSLSGNGSTLAVANIAVSTNRGDVRIFNYDTETNQWVQVSDTYTGSASYAYYGANMDLNENGDVLVVGAPGFYRVQPPIIVNGVTQVFKNNDGTWEQLGSTQTGTPGSNIGMSVNLNGSGSILAIGYPNAVTTGQVKVYGYECQLNTPVVAVQESVCEGKTALLTISNIEEGNIYNWYDSADSVEPVFTGTEFTTPELTEATSFWVEAYNAPCSQRTEAIVSVTTLPELIIETTSAETCEGTYITLTANSEDNNIIKWYNSPDATESIFTGPEYTTPELTESTSYWVEAINATGCISERQEIVVTVIPSPELIVVNTSIETCESTSTIVTATSEGNIIKWYDSIDATTPIFTGSEYTTLELTETTSYWVEATSAEGCISERTEVIVTVIPAPELTLETTAPEVCSGTEAQLFATSEGNVIFWYANEDEEEYLYHGNLFVTPELTETTTYWVEAYNIFTGCSSERIEVTVTVNPVPDAPIAISYQTVEEGITLADLDVDADGTLTWYANEALTVVLPDTTLVEENTIYYVTQTLAGCESAATEVSVGFLGLTDINGNNFTVYPNPTQGIVKIQSKVAVSHIEVFSVSGQAVKSVKAANEVNLSGFTSETYVLRITLENGEVVTKKVIKK